MHTCTCTCTCTCDMQAHIYIYGLRVGVSKNIKLIDTPPPTQKNSPHTHSKTLQTRHYYYRGNECPAPSVPTWSQPLTQRPWPPVVRENKVLRPNKKAPRGRGKQPAPAPLFCPQTPLPERLGFQPTCIVRTLLRCCKAAGSGPWRPNPRRPDGPDGGASCGGGLLARVCGASRQASLASLSARRSYLQLTTAYYCLLRTYY